jgi:prlF antitoxin for toxin YhaV_toxin
MPVTQYEGSVVQVGNSRGMRLPAGFFNAHPEFSGKVRATFVGDGQVLISAQPVAKSKAAKPESDPVMESFLSFLERQMAEHPDQIMPADAAQLRRIEALVADVKVG